MVLNIAVIVLYSIMVDRSREKVSVYIYFVMESGTLLSSIFIAYAIFKIRRFLDSTGFKKQINYNHFIVHALCFLFFIGQTLLYDTIYSIYVLEPNTDSHRKILYISAILNVILDFSV